MSPVVLSQKTGLQGKFRKCRMDLPIQARIRRCSENSFHTVAHIHHNSSQRLKRESEMGLND